jgi:quinol monooxygenase YgiN
MQPSFRAQRRIHVRSAVTEGRESDPDTHNVSKPVIHHTPKEHTLMIVLAAYYFGKPGTGDTVAAKLKEMAVEVKATEPGCLLYHANRAVDEPDNFLLYEHYRDQEALAAHRETPHFKEIIEGTIVPLLERRERELYGPVVVG